MQRFPYICPVALKFVFEDLDGFPVSIKDADIDIWIYTRTTAPAFPVSIRQDFKMGAALPDDSSVLVKLPPSALPPGKLKATVNVKASFGNPVHNHKEDSFHGKDEECFVFNPEVPVELIDNIKNYHNNGAVKPEHPVIIKCKFKIRRPQLVRHVTKAELDKAIENALENVGGNQIAAQSDIDPIIAMFSIPEIQDPVNNN